MALTAGISVSGVKTGAIEHMLYWADAATAQDMMSLTAVTDLNVLAALGWRVVSCAGLNTRLVWTLQRVAP